jgi:hypothetical protein
LTAAAEDRPARSGKVVCENGPLRAPGIAWMPKPSASMFGRFRGPWFLRGARLFRQLSKGIFQDHRSIDGHR